MIRYFHSTVRNLSWLIPPATSGVTSGPPEVDPSHINALNAPFLVRLPPRHRLVLRLISRYIFALLFTLVTGPRGSLSLKLSDTRVYEPQIRVASYGVIWLRIASYGFTWRYM